MIYFAFAYMLAVWLLTFPALCLRLLKAKSEREYAAMVYIWEALPALLLLSPAFIGGAVIMWTIERLLRALVTAAQLAWRAWLAIGRPAADFTGWAATTILNGGAKR